jgi:glycogen synthase
VRKYSNWEIIICSPELSSFVFCGGLGVMIDNLAKELSYMGFSVTVIVPFYKFDVNGNKINLDNFEILEKSSHEVSKVVSFNCEIILNDGIFPVWLYKTNYNFKQLRNKDNIMENAFCKLTSKPKMSTDIKVWFIRSTNYFNRPYENVSLISSQEIPNNFTV